MKLLTQLLLLLLLASPLRAEEIRLSAAASMTNAVRDLMTAYSATASKVRFLPNFGGSGSLAKQIAQGAPVDLYISANPQWMDYLVDEGLVRKEGVVPLAANALVLVGQSSTSLKTLEQLPSLGRIAIGSPRSVPAGQYTEQALNAAGVLEAVRPNLVLAKDVRHALAYADRGVVDAAFVYKTDALLAQNARVLLEVPVSLHSPIAYPLALTEQGRSNAAAVAFFDYLATEEARTVLRKHGFGVEP